MRHMLPAACLTLSVLAQAALAACPGDLLLSCPIGKKELEICLTGRTVSYSFGPAGKPELTITSPILEAAYTPWSGMGSAMWDAVAFTNKGITYEVWTSVERDPEATEGYQGGINVLKGDKIEAQLTCAPGSVQSDLYPIFEAKEAAGQCWNFDSHSWQMAPCP